jgi:hypothetical protein
MTDVRRPEGQKDQVVTTSMSIVVVHLLWICVGPFVLGCLLFGIAQSQSGWFTGLDLGLLIVVVLMLCARWIDQRSGQAITIEGEPSTSADFRRYVLVTPLVVGIAWIAANVIGNHILTVWGG